jgi:hypothetical protein
MLGGRQGKGLGLLHQAAVQVGQQVVQPRRQAVGAQGGHDPPLLEHEDSVLLHPGLDGAVWEGAVGQSEHEGVAGHGRPELPVGLQQVVGEPHHAVILTADRFDLAASCQRYLATCVHQ